MIEQVGNDLTFYGQFLSGGRRAVGRTVTCTVYRDGNLVTSGQATEQVAGDPDHFMNLMAGWNLNESAGSTRYDVLGNYDMVETPNPLTVDSGGGISWNGADLERTQTYTWLTNVNGAETDLAFTYYDPSVRTICLWYKPETLYNHCSLIGNYDANKIGSWDIYVDSIGDCYFPIWDSGSAERKVKCATKIVAGQWNWICAWYDQSTYKSYIQINDDDPTAFSSTFNVPGTPGAIPSFNIGNRGNAAYPSDGVIDEVYIFSDVKTSAWRTATYNSGAGLFYIPTGIYRYTLPGVAVTQEGEYTAHFNEAAETTDQPDVYAKWSVGRAGVDNLTDRIALGDFAVGTAEWTEAGYWDNLLAGWHLDEDNYWYSVGINRADVLGTHTLLSGGRAVGSIATLANLGPYGLLIHGPTSDNYLQCFATDFRMSGDFTIVMWVYRRGDQGAFDQDNELVVYEDPNDVPDWRFIGDLGNAGADRLYFQVTDIISGTKEVYQTIPDRVWTMVSVTYDSSTKTLRMGMNAGSFTTTTMTYGPKVTGTRLRVGETGSHSDYNRIDEVHIFDAVKDDTWLTGFYASGDGIEYPNEP